MGCTASADDVAEDEALNDPLSKSARRARRNRRAQSRASALNGEVEPSLVQSTRSRRSLRGSHRGENPLDRPPEHDTEDDDALRTNTASEHSSTVAAGNTRHNVQASKAANNNNNNDNDRSDAVGAAEFHAVAAEDQPQEQRADASFLQRAYGRDEEDRAGSAGLVGDIARMAAEEDGGYGGTGGDKQRGAAAVARHPSATRVPLPCGRTEDADSLALPPAAVAPPAGSQGEASVGLRPDDALPEPTNTRSPQQQRDSNSGGAVSNDQQQLQQQQQQQQPQFVDQPQHGGDVRRHSSRSDLPRQHSDASGYHHSRQNSGPAGTHTSGGGGGGPQRSPPGAVNPMDSSGTGRKFTFTFAATGAQSPQVCATPTGERQDSRRASGTGRANSNTRLVPDSPGGAMMGDDASAGFTEMRQPSAMWMGSGTSAAVMGGQPASTPMHSQLGWTSRTTSQGTNRLGVVNPFGMQLVGADRPGSPRSPNAQQGQLSHSDMNLSGSSTNQQHHGGTMGRVSSSRQPPHNSAHGSSSSSVRTASSAGGGQSRSGSTVGGPLTAHQIAHQYQHARAMLTREGFSRRREIVLMYIKPTTLSRVRNWIDQSDHGETPVGSLTNPQHLQASVVRETRKQALGISFGPPKPFQALLKQADPSLPDDVVRPFSLAGAGAGTGTGTGSSSRSGGQRRVSARQV